MIIIKPFSQFIFLFISIIVGLSSLQNNSKIINKIILFMGILIFQLIINLAYKINGKCNLKTKILVSRSINNSLYGLLGLSLYTDILSEDLTIIKVISKNNIGKAFIVSLIVTTVIYSAQAIENTIMDYPKEC